MREIFFNVFILLISIKNWFDVVLLYNTQRDFIFIHKKLILMSIYLQSRIIFFNFFRKKNNLKLNNIENSCFRIDLTYRLFCRAVFEWRNWFLAGWVWGLSQVLFKAYYDFSVPFLLLIKVWVVFYECFKLFFWFSLKLRE